MKSIIVLSIVSFFLIPIGAYSKYHIIKVSGRGGVEGGAICRIINSKKKEIGLRCEAPNKYGTEYLMDGTLDFTRTKKVGLGNNKSIRALFIHPKFQDNIIVTLASTDEETVYNVTKYVHNYFDNFTGMMGASSVNKEKMIEIGNEIPFHKGAERFYREIGYLK